MTDDKKVKADDYGDTVVKSLKDLWKKNELCDFKVSAGGHVYDVSFITTKILKIGTLYCCNYAPNFEDVDWAYSFQVVHSCVHASIRVCIGSSKTVHARVLKFHIWIPHKKI